MHYVGMDCHIKTLDFAVVNEADARPHKRTNVKQMDLRNNVASVAHTREKSMPGQLNPGLNSNSGAASPLGLTAINLCHALRLYGIIPAYNSFRQEVSKKWKGKSSTSKR